MAGVITTVRHAATGNATRRVISGTLDEPLSDIGRAQARDTLAKLGRLQADLVISSPLSRSLETARILTGLELPEIAIWKSCIERSYGRLQGLEPEAVAAWRAKITYVNVGGIDHSVNPPDGETLGALRARARRVARRLRNRPEDSILLFSHQTFIQQLIGVLTGRSPLEALAIDIAVLQIDRLALHAGRAATWTPMHAGERGIKSW